MRNGLKIIQLTGGYYGYAITKIAYVRRVSGDEYEILPGARIIAKISGSGRRLEGLAARGPMKDYKLYDPSETIEEIHRLTVRRCLIADETVWSTHIDRPPGFVVASED